MQEGHMSQRLYDLESAWCW